ncbi:MAG: hypothetical protein MHM6MM_003734 [Cercozoa sp. M6MM]
MSSFRRLGGHGARALTDSSKKREKTPPDADPKVQAAAKPAVAPSASTQRAKARGTKAWLHGVHTCSTGMPRLDNALPCKGLPLHTLTVLRRDIESDYARIFVQSIASMALAQQCPVLFIGTKRRLRVMRESMPKISHGAAIDTDNLGVSKKERKDIRKREKASQKLGASEMKIAFQYEKYLHSQSTSETSNLGNVVTSSDFQLDFSSPTPQRILEFDIQTFEFSDASMQERFEQRRKARVLSAAHAATLAVEVFAGVLGENHGRVFLCNVTHAAWDETSTAKLLQVLRRLTRRWPLLAVATASADRPYFEHADAVLHVESFQGDMQSFAAESQYGDFDGVLHLLRTRTEQMASLSPRVMHTPKHRRMLFKMTRHCMKLRRFALPPEQSRSTRKITQVEVSSGSASGASRSTSAVSSITSTEKKDARAALAEF